MKSIRVHFIISSSAVVLVLFLLISAAAVYYVHKATEDQISRSLKTIIDQKTADLNNSFDSIEHSVNTLESYILYSIDTERFRTDAVYAADFLKTLEENAHRIAKFNETAKTIYFGPDVSVYGADKTLYLVNPADIFTTKLSFDAAQYDKADITHFGWYYIPQETKKASWFGPFPNRNTEFDADTVSYAVPMYVNNTFFAVLGMDMSVQLLRSIIDNISYETAFGFLVSTKGEFLYHKDFPGGIHALDFAQDPDLLALQTYFASEYVGTGKKYRYSWRGETQDLVINRLKNGMLIAISVSDAELHVFQSKLLFQLIILFFIVLAVTLPLLNIIAQRIVRPMHVISVAASRIARGEFGTTIHVHADNELGELATSIEKIAVELKEYIAYINEQAYNDAMTGTKNKSAYIDRVKELDLRISENMADFTVFVFDVNGLKHMNDTHGHEFGDMLIQDAATVIRGVFSENAIYRTGGDEFVVLCEAKSEEERAELSKTFETQLKLFNTEKTHYDEPLTVSYGSATFDKTRDKDFNAVFARADEAMYACKAAYYSTHADRRRQ